MEIYTVAVIDSDYSAVEYSAISFYFHDFLLYVRVCLTPVVWFHCYLKLLILFYNIVVAYMCADKIELLLFIMYYNQFTCMIRARNNSLVAQ